MESQQENWALPRGQLANLLYNEYQYRHSLLWSVIKYYVLITISLFAFPIFSLNTNIKIQLGFKLILFPILALLTIIMGCWHISSEALRFKSVSEKYNEIRGKENRPPWSLANKKWNFWEQLLSEEMNQLFIIFYILFSFIVFIYSSLIIIDFSLFNIPWYVYISFGLIPLFFVIRFLIRINNKKRKHNEDFDNTSVAHNIELES